MDIISKLENRWNSIDYPFLIYGEEKIFFDSLKKAEIQDISCIKKGDVVALIGDFDPNTILTLLRLIELDVIIVPLTEQTKNNHDYFFESCGVDVVISKNDIMRIRDKWFENPLLLQLRNQQKPGLVLFSTGTTGKPKAILHDMSKFLKRFETPRPTLKTLSFLLFDHIGGINTLLHTLFNRGTVVTTSERTVHSVLADCAKHQIELLPATPTFLRMMLLSGLIPTDVPKNLRVITYGTERMDQSTLSDLSNLLPHVDFRQTYGMSELGILRIKSQSRNSLFMKIGGEGIETKIENDILWIKSENRMLGYLNADNPFDEEGWYNTKDRVETEGEYIKIIGRDSDVINVGGLKFLASEVETIALAHPKVAQAQVYTRNNPITGQHVEILVEPLSESGLTAQELSAYFHEKLSAHMRPRRIIFSKIEIGHRFKKLIKTTAFKNS